MSWLLLSQHDKNEQPNALPATASLWLKMDVIKFPPNRYIHFKQGHVVVQVYKIQIW